jgi:8-oxo-dGTP diphosphatase
MPSVAERATAGAAQPDPAPVATNQVAAAAPRQAVDVAVGVLLDSEGRFLMTSRPTGKVYAGYWEFPGGKFEPGETVQQALARELHEEIGIHIGAAELFHTEEMDYPHARVRLHFCRVLQWQGAFEMREAQQMAWQSLPVQCVPVLPGAFPVLRALAAAQGFTGALSLDAGP